MRVLKCTALLLTLVLFCACTRQESIDIFAFCDRFNALQEEDMLNAASLFQEDEETAKEYHTEFAFCTGHTALLSVTVDETETVTGFQLTVIPEDAAFDEAAQQALFETYVELVSVLTTAQNPEEALTGVQAAGIAAENLHFTDFGYAGEYEDRQYAVFSGEQYLSLFCTAL